ncbi:hypothetical protein CWB81_11295 [Pseudoalteromonas sp. S1688]|jgi:hypothetical protein|nr:hypothetical protein CWB81_11295 [Pseudoalteromonas sp. S1688]
MINYSQPEIEPSFVSFAFSSFSMSIPNRRAPLAVSQNISFALFALKYPSAIKNLAVDMNGSLDDKLADTSVDPGNVSDASASNFIATLLNRSVRELFFIFSPFVCWFSNSHLHASRQKGAF